MASLAQRMSNMRVIERHVGDRRISRAIARRTPDLVLRANLTHWETFLSHFDLDERDMLGIYTQAPDLFTATDMHECSMCIYRLRQIGHTNASIGMLIANHPRFLLTRSEK